MYNGLLHVKRFGQPVAAEAEGERARGNRKLRWRSWASAGGGGGRERMEYENDDVICCSLQNTLHFSWTVYCVPDISTIVKSLYQNGWSKRHCFQQCLRVRIALARFISIYTLLDNAFEGQNAIRYTQQMRKYDRQILSCEVIYFPTEWQLRKRRSIGT